MTHLTATVAFVLSWLTGHRCFSDLRPPLRHCVSVRGPAPACGHHLCVLPPTCRIHIFHSGENARHLMDNFRGAIAAGRVKLTKACLVPMSLLLLEVWVCPQPWLAERKSKRKTQNELK